MVFFWRDYLTEALQAAFSAIVARDSDRLAPSGYVHFHAKYQSRTEIRFTTGMFNTIRASNQYVQYMAE